MEGDPAMPVDTDNLNVFLGRLVGDLGAAVHTGMVVIGERLGLYKALALGPNDLGGACLQNANR